MGLLGNLVGGSPFKALVGHARKVHECVSLLRPLTDALLNGQFDEIERLHHKMSETEHEADLLKTHIRETFSNSIFLSIDRHDLKRYVGIQDDIADAAEDYAVVLTLRNTKVPKELHEDFLAFVSQVISVSEHLLSIAEELAMLAESAFSGTEAQKILDGIEKVGEEEWNADKLQRRFAKHSYSIEETMDPVTLSFLDKYRRTLSTVANNAEKTSKFLREIIRK